VASADPLPELTDPGVALMEGDEVAGLSAGLSTVAPGEPLPLPDSDSSLARAAAPIAIVATAAATARPDVTATVWRRALSRWFIGPSCGR
jgi:hypothetical protein